MWRGAGAGAWGAGEGFTGASPWGPPTVYLLSLGRSDPVTRPHQEGESSGTDGAGSPPPSWNTGNASPHLEDRTPHIWKSDNIRCWGGGASFSLSFQMFGKSIEKKRGRGRVHRDKPEIPQEKTARGGHTEREALGRPHCPGPMALKTTDSGCPTGTPATHRHNQ